LPAGDNGLQVPQDRRRDDGLGLGGGELVVLPGGEVLVAGPVNRVGPLGSPDRAPGCQPQAGASLPGQPGPAGESARQFLPRGQARRGPPRCPDRCPPRRSTYDDALRPSAQRGGRRRRPGRRRGARPRCPRVTAPVRPRPRPADRGARRSGAPGPPPRALLTAACRRPGRRRAARPASARRRASPTPRPGEPVPRARRPRRGARPGDAARAGGPLRLPGRLPGHGGLLQRHGLRF